MEIGYIERKTGEKRIEKVYGYKALSFLYGEGWIRRFFSSFLLPLLAYLPFFSYLYGALQKRKGSVKKIAPFIEAYGIDPDEFERSDFSSFNDFFIRKLKKEKRAVVSDPRTAAMPADARYFVYPHFSHFLVKGKQFSLEDFLQNQAAFNRYKEGAMAIARLCPSDYHRFHFPCDGVPSESRLINGPLFSVNPMALARRLSILAENKRMIAELETDSFGTLLYIEIGATSVGSIHQTYVPGRAVRKGDEKGYFEFGASCLVLLFEKGRIEFDADLVQNTRLGLETRGNFGESLGRVPS